MNDEKNLDELDEELEVANDTEEDPADGEELSDEFDYDDDGDITIPEEDDERPEDGEEPEDDEDAENDVTPDEGDAPETDVEEVNEEEQPPAPSDTADKAEIARLKRELESYKNQTADTLKKMGVDSDDPLKGLASLAAEADGVSVDEYLKNKKAAESQAEAARLLRDSEYEQIFERDIAELHAAYPETAQYKHIRELPDDIRHKFAKNRELGLSAEEAYAAANPRGIRSEAISAARKAPPPTKSHLRTVVPKGSKDNSVPLSRRELEQYRDVFPDASDEEIKRLYKNATKK